MNQDDVAKMAAEMGKGQGRHEDIPEEDEEEEVTTPTAHSHGEAMVTGRQQALPSQVRWSEYRWGIPSQV